MRVARKFSTYDIKSKIATHGMTIDPEYNLQPGLCVDFI